MDKTVISKILARLERIEKALFKEKPNQVRDKSKPDFTGPKGGILYLLSKGLLKKKRTAADVKSEMEKNDYHYNIQVIQTALNRLSKKDGPLVSFRDNGKKVYVQRK